MADGVSEAIEGETTKKDQEGEELMRNRRTIGELNQFNYVSTEKLQAMLFPNPQNRSATLPFLCPSTGQALKSNKTHSV